MAHRLDPYGKSYEKSLTALIRLFIKKMDGQEQTTVRPFAFTIEPAAVSSFVSVDNGTNGRNGSPIADIPNDQTSLRFFDGRGVAQNEPKGGRMMSEEPITLTKRLVEFDTVNPPGKERECAHFLGEMLAASGCEVHYCEFAPARTCLIARFGDSSKPAICFSGHFDTVPLGERKWTYPPFEGRIVGDKLYGRGSSDMKGGVAAMVTAVLTAIGTTPDGLNVLLVVTAGEETGCAGSRFLAQTPQALGKIGALVVGEPTSNYPVLGHKGVLWIRAEVGGSSVHGSTPEKGDNAIYKLLEPIDRLRKLTFDLPPHAIFGSPTLNIGKVWGGQNINSVPDKAGFGIDIRTVIGQRNRAVFDNIRSIVGGDFQLKEIENMEPVFTDPDDPWIGRVFRVVSPYLGFRPEPRIISYGTDAAHLKTAGNNPPAIILGPGEPQMAHCTDEFCSVEKIETCVSIYSDLISEWTAYSG